MSRDYLKERENNPYRNEYVSSLNDYVHNLYKETENVRAVYTKTTDVDKRKQDYIKTLGYPLDDDKVDKSVKVIKKEKIDEINDLDIIRIQFDVLGIKAFGLLFKHRNLKGKQPFAIFQHGANDGPEMAGSLFGDSFNYNDVVMRLCSLGINVFAPQSLIWLTDRYKTDYNRELLNAQLINMGGSFMALEIFIFQRMIDYFEKQDYVDSNKIGYMGLSWGGMYALNMGAVDDRIKVTYSSCFFNERECNSRIDFAHHNQAYMFFDAEIATLIYPRYLCIECGKNDPLFSIDGAKREKKRLLNYIEYFNMDKDKIVFNFFDGSHEVSKDDGYFNWFYDKLKNS